MVVVLVAGCYLFPQLIIELMFGLDYVEIAPLLGPYALATGCFALANVFVYYAISIDQYRAVWLALGFGLIQLISFTIFHESLLQIVYIQLVYMSLLLLSQILLICTRKPVKRLI